MRRTILDAQSAVGTKCSVYVSDEILDGDRSGRTVLLALHAAYASYLADLAGNGALVLVGAHDHSGRLAVGDLDQLLGADLGALAAADAEIAVHNCQFVAKLDRVIFAFPRAVAEADAAEAAGIHSAVKLDGSGAGVNAYVIHLDGGVVAGNFPEATWY